MSFADELILQVRSGKGGAGCLSFLRARGIARGGPDGGDGGKGGSVFFVASSRMRTFHHLLRTRHIHAENGQPGQGSQRTGRNGEDTTIYVPLGTRVHDAVDDSIVLAELTEEGQRVLIAPGGEGGYGNRRFRSSTNRAPRRTTDGKPAENLQIKLELELLADAGLVGKPNAGKSQLLRTVSRSKTKVGSYQFTTLEPQLGVVANAGGRSIVLADMPGLVSGASDGVGLGHRFLRHLSRVQILLVCVDMAQDADGMSSDLRVSIDEIMRSEHDFSQKQFWLVGTKSDIAEDSAKGELNDLAGSVTEVKWQQVLTTSALTHTGTDELCDLLLASAGDNTILDEGAEQGHEQQWNFSNFSSTTGS